MTQTEAQHTETPTTAAAPRPRARILLVAGVIAAIATTTAIALALTRSDGPSEPVLAEPSASATSTTEDPLLPDGDDDVQPVGGTTSEDPDDTPTPEPSLDAELPAEWPIVRGVYSTMWSFAGQRWDTMIQLVETTELNAVVVDVKDDDGRLAWEMDLPLARTGGAEGPRIDPTERIQRLRDAGGYPIARIVCFKDTPVATSRPDLAVVDVRTGRPWEGRDGRHWLNPYDPEAWQWCVDVAKEAARVGFLEIQFDYVRFPNGGDGPSEYFDFPGRPDDLPRSEWRHPDEITEFLTSAVEQLHAEGVRVSADVFGLTTYNWSWDGDGTGQVFERLAEVLDYVSPMVYPSHYGPGNYGLRPHPVDFPYETVWNAMSEAQMRSQGLRAGIRPWIEDFAPTWLGRGHSPQRVRDQKRAVYDNGIEGWMLWNASNRYSVEALESEAVSRATGDYTPPARTRDPDPSPGTEPREWPGYVEGASNESQHIGEGNSAGTTLDGGAQDGATSEEADDAR